MKLTRFVITASLPGVVVGLLVGSANLIMGFRDNPQGMYLNPLTGAVDWSFAVQMFLFYFTMAFAAVSVVVAIGLAVYTALRSLFLRVRNRKS
jgi:hypothetical protein